MGFVLEFHFSPNEYFSNSVLTKEYEMKCTPDESDPFTFEGPEIYKCKVNCLMFWGALVKILPDRLSSRFPELQVVVCRMPFLFSLLMCDNVSFA